MDKPKSVDEAVEEAGIILASVGYDFKDSLERENKKAERDVAIGLGLMFLSGGASVNFASKAFMLIHHYVSNQMLPENSTPTQLAMYSLGAIASAVISSANGILAKRTLEYISSTKETIKEIETSLLDLKKYLH